MRRMWYVGLLPCVLMLIPVSASGSTLEGLTIQEVLIDGLPEKSIPSPDEFFYLIRETRRGTPANKEAIMRDAQRLMDSGYFYEVSASMRSLGNDSVAVIFRVDPHPVVRAIEIGGLSIFYPDQVAAQMQTKVGTILSTVTIGEDARRINEWFVAQGYPLGRLISFSMDDTGRLTLHIDEGLVTGIQFTGLQRISPDALRSALPIKPGSILTSSALSESLRKLESIPRIRRVADVRYADDSAGTGAVITFDVEEQLTGVYEIGAGYNTRDGFVVYGNIQETDLFMSGRTLGARFRLSQATSLYELHYEDPVTLSMLWDRLTIDVYRKQYPVNYSAPEVKETRSGVRLAIGHKLTPTTMVTAGGSVNTITTGSEKKRLTTLDASWDQVNDSGIANIGMTVSLPSLGSSFDYLKVEGKFIHEKPIPIGAIVSKLQGGVITGDSIPSSELFRVGGLGTLRGYPYGSMQGDRMFVLNLEYRTPPIHVVQGIAFVDYGATWNHGESASMHASYGVGARINTPIGALQLSLASDEYRKFKLVFGLGETW